MLTFIIPVFVCFCFFFCSVLLDSQLELVFKRLSSRHTKVRQVKYSWITGCLYFPPCGVQPSKSVNFLSKVTKIEEHRRTDVSEGYPRFMDNHFYLHGEHRRVVLVVSGLVAKSCHSLTIHELCSPSRILSVKVHNRNTTVGCHFLPVDLPNVCLVKIILLVQTIILSSHGKDRQREESRAGKERGRTRDKESRNIVSVFWTLILLEGVSTGSQLHFQKAPSPNINTNAKG